jgi:ammonium transporter Rh
MLTNSSVDPFIGERYMAFQDTNVMILIGFGFLMTFIKTYSLTTLTLTFFINAVIMQLYPLLTTFWTKAFQGFANSNYYILMD